MNFAAKLFLACSGVLLTGSGSFVYNTAERVSALEAHRQDDNARLERIENKLDEALKRIK